MGEKSNKKRRGSIGSSNGISPSPKSRKKANGAATTDDSKPTDAQLNTVYDLIETRASELELQDQPSVLYPSHGTQYVAYSAADIHRLSTNAAIYYSSIVPARTSSDERPLVVALLAPSSFDYLITALGLSRLGHTILFLSTRLSEDAHAHLIDECDVKHVFVDALFSGTARKVSERLSGLSVHLIASRDQITTHDEPLNVDQNLNPLRERNNVAWIIHSSGSTSLPRPNYYTHAAALKNFQSQFGMVGLITLPLFHMQGLGSVFRSIMNRKPIYMWNAGLPVTSQHLTAVLRQHPDIQILYGVPYVMKLLADSEEGIELSRRLDVLFCGGGACSKPVGDLLTSKGVYLVSHLGSSETGQLMNSYRPREEINEWDWLRPSQELQRYLRWEPYDSQNNIFEMVVLEGWPSKVVSNRDDGSYATKDLWERHPKYPNKNAWRYYARKDDTIVLSNGEKANPILFEDCARESTLVDDAIVFGAQKAHLGIFLLPSAASSNPGQVIEAVWPLIQRANKLAPAHAQMSKEMIQVFDTGPTRLIKRTDKSTIIRPAFYKEFAASIDAAYDLPTNSGSLVLDREDLVEFITSETKALVQNEDPVLIEGDVDLFSLGFDSLQASRLRSKILKHVDIGGKDLTESFVFDNPSINAMAAEILRTRNNAGSKPKMSTEEKMNKLVQKYSLDLPIHRPHMDEPVTLDEHVVVTGATGSLGAHIVAQLASKSEVRGIYCLVRAKSHEEAHERVRRSLRERGINVDDDRFKAFAVDFKGAQLSLSDAEHAELAKKATCVIHSAWSVNFNLSLESFEADCIRGTRSLIDLCLQAGGRPSAIFIFCSSISAVADTPSAEIGEEPCSSLSFAQNMGYAQSKLVAEHICLNASRQSGLHCRVLRIGQIVGDTTLGIWNRQEAVPMIFQSAHTIKTLPELDEDCSWLPVDIVAKAVIDCKDDLGNTKSGEALFDVYNLVNENRLHWSKDLMPMLRKAGLAFEAVSPQEWLRRLREHPDPARNPPFKLIDFFTAKYGGDVARKASRYRCEKARQASAALRQYYQLDQELLNKFVKHILEA